MKLFGIVFLFFNLFCSSRAEAQNIPLQTKNVLLNDSAISQGHIGICIYEPESNKYWYNYNASKYFIPASNTKLFSLYAGMKYLGDSLVGLRYQVDDNGNYLLYPAADPTFLHPDFERQPVYTFLKKIPGWTFVVNAWKTEAYGKGWAWDDFNDDYMAERSILPVYGNVISFLYKNNKLVTEPYNKFAVGYSNDYAFEQKPDFSLLQEKKMPGNFSIKRKKNANVYEFVKSDSTFETIAIPFITDTSLLGDLLMDTLGTGTRPAFVITDSLVHYDGLKVVYSQLADAVFTPMMHRSDNFFAEQVLLMASNEYLGYINEKKLIDTLLKTHLKEIPQLPQWVDGSGLSRYNLFTPQAFVFVLNKMKNEFGLQRLKKILPTGGEGTLKKYYKADAGFIFAKTGTLSNNMALSGYLITKKGKLLIFSVMAGNYTSSATPVRRAVEKFLLEIRAKN